MIKFCLPVIDSGSMDVLDTITNNLGAYDAFEIWLDYLKDFDLSLIDRLSSLNNNDVIVLFRRQNLVPIKMPLELRLAVIERLASSKILLDLDISTQEQELTHIVKSKLPIRLITSFHDYEKTPMTEQLLDIRIKMSAYSPEIAKFATYCRDEASIFRLFSLIDEFKRSDQRFIVTGMGELGKLVRIVGAATGNAFNFAPLTKASATADGQLTIEQLKKLIDIMEINDAR